MFQFIFESSQVNLDIKWLKIWRWKQQEEKKLQVEAVATNNLTTTTTDGALEDTTEITSKADQWVTQEITDHSVEVNQEISEAAQEAEAGYLEAKAKGL